MSDAERLLTFEPAFDRRDPDPSKNYGIHGVTLRMVLKGLEGAVQFVLYTNWMLPEVQAEQDARPSLRNPHLLCHPLPADLGYHRRAPRYEGQSQSDKCDYLDGQPCYYDGSSLNAERVYERLLREGDAGVWAELEDFYREVILEPVEVPA